MDKQKAIHALKDITKILNRYNIPLWLDCGTLLGAVRENRIIPWDDDVDLGVFIDKINKKTIKKTLAKQLEKKGFIVHFFWDVININRDGVCVTLHYYHVKKEKNEAYVKRIKGYNSVGSFLTQMRRLLSVEYYGKFILKTRESRRYTLKTILFKFAQ